METKITDYDKNDRKIYDILHETAVICEQNHYKTNSGKLILEWDESGEFMHMRDLKKYIETFEKTCYLKNPTQIDSFTRRLKANDFQCKLTNKVHSSKVSHVYFKRDCKEDWNEIRTVIKRPVQKTKNVQETTTNGNVNHTQVVANLKKDTAELRDKIEELIKQNCSVSDLSKVIAEENETLKRRIDVLEEKSHTNNQHTYCMKKVLNKQGFPTPIVSSEFSLCESERKIITDEVAAQPDSELKTTNVALVEENASLKQTVNMFETQNRVHNERAYRIKKDLEQQGFPAPSNSSEFNLDESTRKIITDEVEKDHAARYQCDSGTSVSSGRSGSERKRPSFPSRSEISEKRSKNAEHSKPPELVVESTDFCSTSVTENTNRLNTTILQPSFSTEFPDIIDELYNTKNI